MSLEIALKENTEAIYAFIAEIKRSNLRTPEPIPAYETKAIPPCSGHAVQQEVEIATADAFDPPAVNADTVRIALKDLFGSEGGREKVAALLAKYGATKLPEVSSENLAPLYNDIKALN